VFEQYHPIAACFSAEIDAYPAFNQLQQRFDCQPGSPGLPLAGVALNAL
jgi:hypothetical protein